VPASLLVPDELLLPANDPVGFRLLRLMGWRDGQGVGPRRKRARSLGDDDGEEDEVGREGVLHKDFKFAPQDVQIFEAQIKDDLFGLGFDPLAHTPEFAGLLQSSSAVLLRRHKSLSSRVSFGGCGQAGT
jgi:G patch domain-containing protein 1